MQSGGPQRGVGGWWYIVSEAGVQVVWGVGGHSWGCMWWQCSVAGHYRPCVWWGGTGVYTRDRAILGSGLHVEQIIFIE